MRKLIIVCIGALLLSTISLSAKTYDLVLVHGLSNKHAWSTSFLDMCLQKFGSGNVYAIYTNESTRVWERWINGRKVICCGENDYTAGDNDVSTQAQLMHTKIVLLKNSYGLSAKFNIIAHSMGGLVSRKYIYDRPYTVAGLVTLATPHQGSPLTDVGQFLAFFIGAEDAVQNLKPSWCKGYFNPTFPVSGAPLADSGQVYTIGGDGDGLDCWGWGGELLIGWNALTLMYFRDSDGAVARGDEKISGATHITTYWDYDHMDLVTHSDVAAKACDYLR